MTEPGEMPAAGRWTAEGAPRHIFPVRVYYEDTDAGGIVYHASYFRFAERARTELLRTMGREQFRLLRDQGIGFAVRACRADFLAPARLDDLLEVHSTVEEVRGASLRLRQRIGCGARLLCDLDVRLAVMNRRGRPARIPKDIRTALGALVAPPSAGAGEEPGASACGGRPRPAAAPRDCHTSFVDPSTDLR